jgi:hypothetical protein
LFFGGWFFPIAVGTHADAQGVDAEVTHALAVTRDARFAFALVFRAGVRVGRLRRVRALGVDVLGADRGGLAVRR